MEYHTNQLRKKPITRRLKIIKLKLSCCPPESQLARDLDPRLGRSTLDLHPCSSPADAHAVSDPAVWNTLFHIPASPAAARRMIQRFVLRFSIPQSRIPASVSKFLILDHLTSLHTPIVAHHATCLTAPSCRRHALLVCSRGDLNHSYVRQTHAPAQT